MRLTKVLLTWPLRINIASAFMFETPEFRNRLRETINRYATANAMRFTEDFAEDFLLALAQVNEAPLMLTERRLPPGQRRGISQALESATTLLAEARVVARAGRRTAISPQDIIEAYGRKYCQIWPFCR